MNKSSPTPEQTRKCSNCMWWEVWRLYEGSADHARKGVCRDASTKTVLLHTLASDHCGSFRMKARLFWSG